MASATGTTSSTQASAPGWDGPPYLEHPLDPAVRRRAAAEARSLVDAARTDPTRLERWTVRDTDLEEIVALVVQSVCGTFHVAFAAWETEAAAATGAAQPAKPAAAPKAAAAQPTRRSPAAGKKPKKPRVVPAAAAAGQKVA